MSQIIPEGSPQNGRGWGIESLQGDRLSLCRKTGEIMKMIANPDASFSGPRRRTLFLRVTDVGLEPLFSDQTLLFRGYISESPLAFEGRTIDGFDPGVVQYVEGMMISGTRGKIGAHTPGTDDDAPGAEPWIIRDIGIGRSATIGTVLARSEAEAARRCGFAKTEETHRDRAIYVGTPNMAITPGRLPRLQLFPLGILTKFPLS